MTTTSIMLVRVISSTSDADYTLESNCGCRDTAGLPQDTRRCHWIRTRFGSWHSSELILSENRHTKTPQTRLSNGALSSRRHRRVAIFQTLWLREWLPTRTATVEILSTAIHVLEHPSEGILTAHLRPFVPAISNE